MTLTVFVKYVYQIEACTLHSMVIVSLVHASAIRVIDESSQLDHYKVTENLSKKMLLAIIS